MICAILLMFAIFSFCYLLFRLDELKIFLFNFFENPQTLKFQKKLIRQGLGVLEKIDTKYFYFHLEYQPNTSNKMIYQTIPAKYLDQHTDLLEAVAEGAILRNMCKQLANTRAEELMQIESSGDALKVGKDINVLKNLEFTIDKNGPIIFFAQIHG